MQRDTELECINHGPSSDSSAPEVLLPPQAVNMVQQQGGMSVKEICLQHLTATIQICSLLFTTLIVLLCFSGEVVLFTWHPLLLSIGWAFFMTQAVLLILKENFLFGTSTRNIRIRIHWILQSLAIICIITGFTIILINKNLHNKEHFATWHGLLGLIGVICAITTTIGGISAKYSLSLRNLMKPKYTKCLHILGAFITGVFGGGALILSVFSKWFERNTNDNRMVFVVALITTVIIFLWSTLRPLYRSYEFLKHR